MPSDPRYSKRHIRFDHFSSSRTYTSRPRPITTSLRGDLAEHRSRIPGEFRAALAEAYESLADLRDLARGVYLQVEGQPGEALSDGVEWPSKGIRLSALRQVDDIQVAALYVPEESQSYLLAKVDTYAAQDTSEDSGRPKNKVLASVDRVGVAHAQALWTDFRSFPTDSTSLIWWECWCWKADLSDFLGVLAKEGLRYSENFLRFPELIVVPVYTDVAGIDRIVKLADGAIEELRKAEDNPVFFTRDASSDQLLWMEDLLRRVDFSPDCHVSVCLLDTGVARAHPLIEPALPIGSCIAVDSAWGTDDHSFDGHGTAMAGVVLYGDLVHPLVSTDRIQLDHCLESVTFIAPVGMRATDPLSYGSITQSAVAGMEAANPNLDRAICMAVTNDDVSGEAPSSWSSAVDQICAGVAIGDEVGSDSEDTFKRLFLISAGNVPDDATVEDAQSYDEFPVEDPAQAWNALTIGAYTDKTDLTGMTGYSGWSVYSAAGELSPYSRTSVDWRHSRTPIKPEVVFEGGNKAVDPAGAEWVSGVDSLSMLSTAKGFTTKPLDTFWATSASTALASRMAAQIMAANRDLWPESIRALIVHSAKWTPPMLAEMQAASKRDRQSLVRKYGYGVPSLDRALGSASFDLAMIAERTIQPFFAEERVVRGGRRSFSDARMNEMHVFNLPWPRESLQRMSGDVRLKVTLSYFVEPSPGQSASVYPADYQSFGLRFDLKRPNETTADFQRHVGGSGFSNDSREQDARWMLGPKSVSAGSLHCDLWQGPAAELAARGAIAVFPVAGWWKTRKSLGRANARARYCLVVSLEAADTSVDLYTEASIAARVGVAVDVES